MNKIRLQTTKLILKDITKANISLIKNLKSQNIS